MEFVDVVRSRRMTRRFDPERAVDWEVVTELVSLAQRAPSAGFTQGWDVLALTDLGDRHRFFDAVSAAVADEGTAVAGTSAPSAGTSRGWAQGVRAAPVLLVVVAHPTAYLDRYAEPDKGWVDRDPARWPIPYWDTDAAMAALLLLLGATDRALASLFFGVPGPAHAAVRHAFAIPEDRRLVGVVALGHERQRVRSPSLRRGRRPLEQVVHRGRFGRHGASESEPTDRICEDDPQILPPTERTRGHGCT